MRATSPMRVRLEAGRLTLFPDPLTWVRFDLSGRWTAALIDAVTWRRSLGGEILGITSERAGEERLHDVFQGDTEQSAHLSSRIHAWSQRALAEGIYDGALVERVPPGVHLKDVMERCALLDADALAASAARFHQIYEGHPILPPDRTEDALVQSTRGCKHNRCTFCMFYREVPFRVRTREAFAAHLDEVADFLGPALSARRGVYLGDASALTANYEMVRAHLELIRERLVPRMLTERVACLSGPHLRNVEPVGAVRTFCDAFLHPLRSEDELACLRDLGLYRIYIGMESGSDRLLEFLKKPATAASIETLVTRAKAVGLAVSLIIMTGVGGHTFHEGHVRDTAALLNRLPLEPRDSLVFSEFFSLPGAPYADDVRARGIQAMTRVECREQMRAMRALLTYPESRAPHRQMYDARQLLF